MDEIEDVMVSFWQGGRMVEAGFIRLACTVVEGHRIWGVPELTTVEMPDAIDRLVIELPIGCVEQEWHMDGPGTLTWEPPPALTGVPLLERAREDGRIRRCRRTREYAALAKAEGRDGN